MINKKLYNIGTLGKPHSLNGYLYINHEVFFRNLDFEKNIVFINNKEFEIEKIKKHLKNRFLIKFKNIDSIEEAEVLRNSKVSILKKDINNYLNNGLPWPGFYINEIINDDIEILGYFYTDKFIFCNLQEKNKNENVIPYNGHYFIYKDNKLNLFNNLIN